MLSCEVCYLIVVIVDGDHLLSFLLELRRTRRLLYRQRGRGEQLKRRRLFLHGIKTRVIYSLVRTHRHDCLDWQRDDRTATGVSYSHPRSYDVATLAVRPLALLAGWLVCHTLWERSSSCRMRSRREQDPVSICLLSCARSLVVLLPHGASLTSNYPRFGSGNRPHDVIGAISI